MHVYLCVGMGTYACHMWRSEDGLRLGSLFHLIWDKVSCSLSCIPDKLTLIACWPYRQCCYVQPCADPRDLNSGPPFIRHMLYALGHLPSSVSFSWDQVFLLFVKPRQTSAMHYSFLNHCSAEITGITTTLSLLTSHSEEEIQSGSVGKVPAISAWWQAIWVQISQYKLGVVSCTCNPDTGGTLTDPWSS